MAIPPLPSWVAAVKFTTLLARRMGQQLRHVRGLSLSSNLTEKYFPNFEKLDVSTDSYCWYKRYDNNEVEHGSLITDHNADGMEGYTYNEEEEEEAKSEEELERYRIRDRARLSAFLSRAPFARTISMNCLPSAQLLRDLTYYLTKLDITFPCIFPQTPSVEPLLPKSWPCNLRTLKFTFTDYPEDHKDLQVLLDLSSLPSTLKKLKIMFSEDGASFSRVRAAEEARSHARQAAEEAGTVYEEGEPIVRKYISVRSLMTGDLSHMTRLRTLSLETRGDVFEEDEVYFTSPQQLPTSSLTTLLDPSLLIADTVFLEAWDEEAKESRFSSLKTLKIATRYCLEEARPSSRYPTFWQNCLVL